MLHMLLEESLKLLRSEKEISMLNKNPHAPTTETRVHEASTDIVQMLETVLQLALTGCMLQDPARKTAVRSEVCPSVAQHDTDKIGTAGAHLTLTSESQHPHQMITSFPVHGCFQLLRIHFLQELL